MTSKMDALENKNIRESVSACSHVTVWAREVRFLRIIVFVNVRECGRAADRGCLYIYSPCYQEAVFAQASEY